ncbi:MAG TPA: FtsX-like permease family protein [Chthoniobacterales bacterium]
MAWRDSRGSRRRLLLFASCISVGVAALVAIGSLKESLRVAIDQQARTLLGADFVVQSRQPLKPAEEVAAMNLARRTAHEIRFASMAVFPDAGDNTRLVQVRAVDPGFPFFGKLETEPQQVDFQETGGALVDERLLLQFHLQVGQKIRLGEADFPIVAVLKRAPGEAISFSGFAPRVYIPMKRLQDTKLLRIGSLSSHYLALELKPAVTPEGAAKALDDANLSFDSVAKRKEDLGETMENLSQFLNLTGFLSLLLGSLGIASAVSVHIRAKAASAGLLRCLGATGAETVQIYGIQALALGLAGSIPGVLLGIAVHKTLPPALAGLLPFKIEAVLSPSAVLAGLGSGVLVSLLFCIPPLLSLRRITALAVLRESAMATSPAFYRAWIGSNLIIALGVVLFAVWQFGGWKRGLIFAASAGVLVFLLNGVAWGLRRLVRVGLKRIPRWPYVLRQGLANLDRPNNRTRLLILALGFCTFTALTLLFTRDILLRQLRIDAGGQPNLILFDIQPNQRKGLADALKANGRPLVEEAPMVTMRLRSVRGREVKDWLNDPKKTIPDWVLKREYRSSYRDHLSVTETLLSGKFEPHWSLDREPVPISIEEGIARDLGVTLGDELSFDVQGLPVKAQVKSIRRVDWRKFRTNFFVIFPSGVLEEAPATFIAVSRADNAAQSAAMQSHLVREFPNVSVIDLELVVSSVRSVLEKVDVAARALAAFAVATTLLILISVLAGSQTQRVRELALLRVLGASSRQATAINLTEFAALGVFGALAGSALSLGAGWALGKWVFKAPFQPSWILVSGAIPTAALVTIFTGTAIHLLGRKRSAWETLRQEVQ